MVARAVRSAALMTAMHIADTATGTARVAEHKQVRAELAPVPLGAVEWVTVATIVLLAVGRVVQMLVGAGAQAAAQAPVRVSWRATAGLAG